METGSVKGWLMLAVLGASGGAHGPVISPTPAAVNLALNVAAQAAPGQTTLEDPGTGLLAVKRVYVDRLTGGETAAQMRDLIIGSLQNAKLFVITENEQRADTFVRGAAEDLVFTDSFSSSEGVRMTLGEGSSSGSGNSTRARSVTNSNSVRSSQRLNVGIGENEATSVRERKHEALATIRMVNKDGDVIWSTTQESNGAKFRGASADVADKITKQLIEDIERMKRKAN